MNRWDFRRGKLLIKNEDKYKFLNSNTKNLLSIGCCVHMCRGQWTSSSVIFLFFFEAVSLTGLELTKEVRMAGQEAPGFSPSLPPQHWADKCTIMSGFFLLGDSGN